MNVKKWYCPEHEYTAPPNSGFAFCPWCETKEEPKAIKTGDIVELVVRDRESPSGNRKAVMYAGFKAVVREIKNDQAFVTTDGTGIMQAVSFKTWWPIADLKGSME